MTELFRNNSPDQALDLSDEETSDDLGVSQGDLDVCLKVLETLANNEDLCARKPFKPVRNMCLIVAERVSGKYYGGGTRRRQKKLQTSLANRRKQLLKNWDEKKIEGAKLREAQARRLKSLLEPVDEASQYPLLPEASKRLQLTDDHRDDGDSVPSLSADLRKDMYDMEASESQKRRENHAGRRARTESGGHAQHAPSEPRVSKALVPRAVDAEVAEAEEYLATPKGCYACKRGFVVVHHFYDQLCPECAALNWSKRLQVCDMSERIAVVSGARVKIGWQVGLKLLRCGAFLVATSRFPKDCAMRYYNAPDSQDWIHRLRVYGLDLRDLKAVELFGKHMEETYPHLDMLINNAAQTVRKPPVFYEHLLPTESMDVSELPTAVQEVLGPYAKFQPHMQLHGALSLLRDQKRTSVPASSNAVATTLHVPVDHEQTSDSAILSQVPILPEDHAERSASSTTSAPETQRSFGNADGCQPSQALAVPASGAEALFPVGRYDKDAQQVDLRTHNSWTMRQHEVSTPELVEVHCINAIGPYILIRLLKPMLQRSPSPVRFVVNVSAMEAKFYRYKTPNHPHTNMAKAALNMLTRTSAADFLRDGIYMNSVDTGWITDEKPLDQVARVVQEGLKQCPIDEVDAAARILDPVMTGIGTFSSLEVLEKPLKLEHGKFYKDYMESEW